MSFSHKKALKSVSQFRCELETKIMYQANVKPWFLTSSWRSDKVFTLLTTLLRLRTSAAFPNNSMSKMVLWRKGWPSSIGGLSGKERCLRTFWTSGISSARAANFAFFFSCNFRCASATCLRFRFLVSSPKTFLVFLALSRFHRTASNFEPEFKPKCVLLKQQCFLSLFLEQA